MLEECFPPRRLHRLRRKHLEHIAATATQVFKHLNEKPIRLILSDTPRRESLQRCIYGECQQAPLEPPKNSGAVEAFAAEII